MMYGPLAQAIENLLNADRTRPAKKDSDGSQQFNASIAKCWRDIERAQAAFYNDVREGRIVESD